MVIGFAGVQEPWVITHNGGGDLGCDFVISATPTNARREKLKVTMRFTKPQIRVRHYK